MEEIEVSSQKRNQMVDITSRVQQIVHDTGLEEGNCLIYCPHTTAAVTINEGADPSVQDDIIRSLKEIVPDIEFRHAEGNSDAHLKSSIVGSSVTVIIKNKNLKLGRWQKIFLCEFDGPRTRRVWVRTSK